MRSSDGTTPLEIADPLSPVSASDQLRPPVFRAIVDFAWTSIDGTTDVTIKLGENLADWPQTFPIPATAVSNNPGLSVTKNSPVAGKDTVTLILPLAPGGQTFARLKVTP